MRRLLPITVTMASVVMLQGVVWAEDYYDWKDRRDRYGQPAGIFDTTPFPIDEFSSSYTVKNDEYPGGKVYNLGTRYYVDGAAPDDAGDGLSLDNAKKTILAAIQTAGNGNKTIIVRGRHDAFDGVYTIDKIVPGHGVDDTHRWTLTGYKQERPVFDGGNSQNDIVGSTGQAKAYATLQRCKLQNSKNQGLRLGKEAVKADNYFNLFDVWIFNCSNDYTIADDGGVYYLNSDYGHVLHCVSEHHYGHGFKFGDGSSQVICEWSISANAGYWPGMTPTAYYNNHPGGIQIVADGTTASPASSNNTVRYCIIHSSLFGGIEIRRSQNYSIHHNELYDCVHYYDVSGCESHAQGSGDASNAQVLINMPTTFGKLYSNIVRDPGRLESGSKATGLAFTVINDSNPTFVYNNLFYGYDKNTVIQKYGCAGQVLKFYNNTLVGANSGDLLSLIETSSSRDCQNNIFYTTGTGACVTYRTGQNKNNNLYYHPNGSRGYSGGFETGGIEGNPLFAAIPAGSYSWGMGNIQSSSPAKDAGADLPSVFATDVNSVTRPQGTAWDIGMYEFPSGTGALPAAQLATSAFAAARISIIGNFKNTLRYKLNYASLVNIDLIKVNGTIIKTLFNGYQLTGAHCIVMDTPGFSNGCYILKITLRDDEFVRRIFFLK